MRKILVDLGFSIITMLPSESQDTPLLASRVDERPNALRLTQLVVESNCFFGLFHMHGDVLIL